MAPRRKKLITAKEVAVLLKVGPEVITYLRQNEKLPYSKNSKYIMFSEPEVLRWRNKKLTEEGVRVLNLREYYNKIQLFKFIDYEAFHEKVNSIAFVDGDWLIQYIKRQNPEKNLMDLVGDIVNAYWEERAPKCRICGTTVRGSYNSDLCYECRKESTKKYSF